MPSQLDIHNSSTSEQIFITLKSTDKKTVHITEKLCLPEETVGITLKGGVKHLTIMDSTKNIWWEGHIPSHIAQPIIIDVDQKKVLHGGYPIVNTHISSIMGLMDTNVILWLTILLLVIVIVWWYYKRK